MANSFTQKVITDIKTLKNHSFCAVSKTYADGSVFYGFAVCRRGGKWEVTFRGNDENQVRAMVCHAVELFDCSTWTSR